MNNTSLTALGGIVTALSVFLMFLTGVIPFLTYIIPGLAGMLLIVLIADNNSKWAVMIYFATSLLSILVVADKESAIMYALFFGYYPILKVFLDKHIAKIPAYLIKLLVFNAAIIASYFIVVYLLGIPFSDTFGKYTIPILLVLGNVTFVLYDFVLNEFYSIYLSKLKRRIDKIFR